MGSLVSRHNVCIGGTPAMHGMATFPGPMSASNSRECMGVIGEALQLHAVYKKLYFFNTSHATVTPESVSGTTSHVHCV